MKKYGTINLPEIMEQEKLQAVAKIRLSPPIKELSRKYVIERSAKTGGGGGSALINQLKNGGGGGSALINQLTHIVTYCLNILEM